MLHTSRKDGDCPEKIILESPTQQPQQTGNKLLGTENPSLSPASQPREGLSELSCHKTKFRRFCRWDHAVSPKAGSLLSSRSTVLVIAWFSRAQPGLWHPGCHMPTKQQHPNRRQYSKRSTAPEPTLADLPHIPSSLGSAPDHSHWDLPHVHPQQQPPLRRSNLL